MQAGDTLSEIAADHGVNDWTKVWPANAGRAEPDGARFTDPDYIEPGWTITIPTPTDMGDNTGHAGLGDNAGDNTVQVAGGDTLSQLAADHDVPLDAVVAANIGRVQPDGSRLTDPDDIRPGWRHRHPRRCHPRRLSPPAAAGPRAGHPADAARGRDTGTGTPLSPAAVTRDQPAVVTRARFTQLPAGRCVRRSVAGTDRRRSRHRRPAGHHRERRRQRPPTGRSERRARRGGAVARRCRAARRRRVAGADPAPAPPVPVPLTRAQHHPNTRRSCRTPSGPCSPPAPAEWVT